MIGVAASVAKIGKIVSGVSPIRERVRDFHALQAWKQAGQPHLAFFPQAGDGSVPICQPSESKTIG
ncbi:MAG: hypothetical protein JO288_14755 [Hyphomicrobiales bacterium]|nr:hypothetical protein [Hyphomicrobiales bacterium]